jgi:hypothetical protein
MLINKKSTPDRQSRLNKLLVELDTSKGNLPLVQKETLAVIIKFMNEIVSHQETNKMN